MRKISLILLMSLATGAAYAQNAGDGVTMSTDPAKADAVEKHAQELQARQTKEATSKPAATHPSTKKTKSKTPTTHKSPATAPKG
jgi:stringent starvation protein B